MALYLNGKSVNYITTVKTKPTQTKTVQPTTETQMIIPDAGYELEKVVVSGYSEDITLDNIKYMKFIDLMNNITINEDIYLDYQPYFQRLANRILGE